ncbi:MAG: hypothetical protein D3908_05540 [Candidatus Electrothrix sp. AUS4]|nr:hypothetical protein [Candidatus Electrothrix sp. AUS4]
MKTMFQSRTFTNRNAQSLAPTSPLAVRTVPGAGFRQGKKNRFRKEMNNSADRRNIRFSPGLLLDYTLFSYILAVDAGLTAKELLRDRLRTKESIPV